jgi:DNA polymerase-1
LLAADYSQIELRLLAHLSGDPALIDAYREGVDIHARTAAALYKVEEADVTAEMRRSSKVVNFGVLYGMGSMRLSQQLKIPRDEAKRFIENYFTRFARVRGYIEETVDAARRQGYVETLSGRRRYLPELHSDNRPVRENAERMAVNTPIQGSAADLIKLAMVAVDAGIRAGEIPCDMLLQVHDELVFECDEADAVRVAEAVRSEMEGAMELSVPLRVELGWAKNWLEAKA